MKTIITAFALLGAGVLISLSSPAQTIGFTYDAAGNRETRAVTSSRSAAVSSNYLVIDPQFQLVTSQIGKQKVKFNFDVGKNLLQVNFPWLGRQEAILQITDLQGKQIVHQNTTSSKNSISISDYPPGYYRLIILIGEEKKAWEIVRK
jgi:YD repeat-containing protein